MAVDSDFDRIIDEAEREFIRLWQAGPQHTRWEEVPVQPGDRAPGFSLPDQHGNQVTLDALIVDSPLLLLFWRHFGCGCGFERAKRLRNELADYRETGATVVIIGQGEPEQAAAFAEQEDLELPILTDRDRSVYRAYGLLEATQPQVLFDAPQWLWSQSSETAEAFTSARRESGRPLVNSPWQLPGEFVIGTDGDIRHAHRFQYCEDFPDPRTHLTALKGGAVVEG